MEAVLLGIHAIVLRRNVAVEHIHHVGQDSLHGRMGQGGMGAGRAHHPEAG